MFQVVDKEGWLTKEGQMVKSWKKRWFILAGSDFSYYTAQKNKLKGTINLENYKVQITKRADGKTCLELTGTGDDKGERVLYFDAESEKESEKEKERQEWFVAINNKISLLNYQKKNRQRDARDDPIILEFFQRPTGQLLDLSRRLDEDFVNLDTISALREPIRFHSYLKTINLSGSRMGDDCLGELSAALKENNSVEKIILKNCAISAKGMKSFGTVFKTNRKLSDIDLSMNGLDDAAMEQFCLGLKEINAESCIKRLCFNENNIGDTGLTLFTEALLFRPKQLQISELEFRKNQIKDAGVQELGQKLLKESRYSYLVTIDLGYNHLGNDAAKALADSLIKNTTLKSLNIENNEIGYMGTKDLAFMIVVRLQQAHLILFLLKPFFCPSEKPAS